LKIIVSIITFLVFYSNLIAQEKISLKWLNNKPRSIAKDFYIWRYLKENITPIQASKALGQVRFMNNKLLFRYAKRFKNKDILFVTNCMQLNEKKLVDKNADCIEVGMSTFKATKLSKKNLSIVIKKVTNKYPKSAKRFQIIKNNKPFVSLIKSSNDVFFDTFNQCGGLFRVKNFNYKLSQKFIKQLQVDKKNFAQTIKLIVTNPKLNKLQLSLFNVDTKNLSHKSTFNLAINAIVHNKNKLALKYLKLSYNNGYFQQDKDKVLFWQYQLTKQKTYLDKLSKSWDNNIYSLFSFEKYNIKPKNIIYKLKENKKSKSDYNENIPFNWLHILADTKKMNNIKMEKYNNLLNKEDTQGHLAFVKERYYRYKKSYFITPYKKYIGKLSTNRQALIYAIARQESRFIQTSISSAYALGVMQIMPFLSRAIAKQIKDTYDIDKQLNPKINLKYANIHLDFLEKRLKHPLFIAYGYNGGIGFAKRLFKNGFFKEGKYEPYLSMELLPYDETKKYGKKVLANYFIYKNHLDKQNHIKISTLFQKAIKQSQN